MAGGSFEIASGVAADPPPPPQRKWLSEIKERGSERDG